MQDVYTLLCHKDMDMAAVTVPRIVSFLNEGQKFIIFDDGSFTEADQSWCAELSSKIEVVTLASRDEQIKDKLSKYPNCLKYRDELPLAFKLLDIPLIAGMKADRFTFTDADIIYLKHCEAYFDRKENTYLQTDAIKLSVKLKDGLLKYKWPIPLRFNSGYFSFGLEHFDLDFIDYYLGLPDVRNMKWLSEQTAWALIFGRAGKSSCPDEQQFVCKEKFDGPQPDTLAIHLIGKENKNKYSLWASPVKSKDISAKFHPSRNITAGDWLQKTLERYINRK